MRRFKMISAWSCWMVFAISCGEVLPEREELGRQQQFLYKGDLGQALGASIANATTCTGANDFTPSCSISSAPDISYTWTAPRRANYTFSTEGSNFDTIIEVRPYNDISQSFGCNDDSGGTTQSSLTVPLEAGQTMLVVVDGYRSQCGNMRLNITSDAAMDFGGMYGESASGPYFNPYTGGRSCPPGFRAYKILGTYNQDYDLYFCGRFPNAFSEPLVDFGGAYGGHDSGTLYPNPVKGSPSCPSGFQSRLTLGSYSVDHSLWYCHMPHVTRTRTRYQFGGMYGYYWNGSGTGVYANPATGSDSCPDGFTRAKILGTYNQDYDVHFCYKDLGP
jgi:hypothetical protein